MARSTLISLVWAVPALVSIGCSCNNDYTFPEPLAVQFADAPPDFGSYLSFGAAPGGNRITMAYYDRLTTGLGFATGTPKEDGTIEWLHEQVDGYPEEDGLDRGDRGRYTSHVVSADGTVWIAYQDTTNGTLKAAKRLGPNQWEAEVVDAGVGLTSSGAGNWASIGLLADGSPIIAHYDKAGGVLRVSYRAENGWVNETAWDGEDVGRYAALFVQGSTTYIAFYNGTDGNLELLEGSPGSWSHSEIDTSGNVGQWPSIWADENQVVVAYHHVGDQNLMLARRSGSSWDKNVIDRGEFRGADTELFLKEGLPHVLYFDGQNNDMILASEGTDGNWTIQTVAGTGIAVGFHNEVVQVGDRFFAGSYDHTNEQLHTVELFQELR